MKTLLLSTTLAAGLGAFALSPAGAASISVNTPAAGAPVATMVACRTVERRVTERGVTRITRQRECNGDRERSSRRYDDDDRRYVDRREYRDSDERPGLNLRLGN